MIKRMTRCYPMIDFVDPNGVSKRSSATKISECCVSRTTPMPRFVRFRAGAPFMGQSVSRGRSVTPCGTGPTFITHLHSFQCRTTSTGGRCFHWYSVTAFFDLSDAPITTISSTLGIEERTMLGKNSISHRISILNYFRWIWNDEFLILGQLSFNSIINWRRSLTHRDIANTCYDKILTSKDYKKNPSSSLIVQFLQGGACVHQKRAAFLDSSRGPVNCSSES